jgi:hypothetical protein
MLALLGRRVEHDSTFGQARGELDTTRNGRRRFA